MDSEPQLGPDTLLAAFEAMGSSLQTRGLSAQFYVVGGTCLLLRGITSRTTRDVDVVAYATSDAALAAAANLPPTLLEIIADVGRAFGLADDWLNAGPAPLFTALPDGWLERSEPRVFGSLTLHLAGRSDLIAFKLYAAADHYPSKGKHLQDLHALRPSPAELDAAQQWALQQDPSEGFRFLLNATVELLTPEADDGRT